MNYFLSLIKKENTKLLNKCLLTKLDQSKNIFIKQRLIINSPRIIGFNLKMNLKIFHSSTSKHFIKQKIFYFKSRRQRF